MSTVSSISQFQNRLAQSRLAKANQRPSEQQHWDSLVDRIEEPKVARTLVRFFDNSPTEKLKHPGLYLRAKIVLSDSFASQEAQAKQARQDWWKEVSARLFGAAYFLWRCIRLPFRAVRDLWALAWQPRRHAHRRLFCR